MMRKQRIVVLLLLLLVFLNVPPSAYSRQETQETPLLSDAPASSLVSCSVGNSPYRVYLPALLTPTTVSTIFLELSEFRFLETVGTATVAVRLDIPSTEVVRVDYELFGISATAGQDFIAAQGTIQFTPGQTTSNLLVTITNDQLVEINETLALKLTNPKNATLSQTRAVPISIIDNDALERVQGGVTITAVRAERNYQWGVTVNPDASERATPVGTAQQIGFGVDVRREELGTIRYTITGKSSIKNTGNIPIDIKSDRIIIEYQTNNTAWISATNDIPIALNPARIPVGVSYTYPFTTTISFATNDGAPPPELTALRARSSVAIFNAAGASTDPFFATTPIALPLPAPVINYATISVRQSGAITPAAAFTLSGGGSNYTVSTTPLQIHTVYTATRVLTSEATLVHQVTIPEIGIAVFGETKLQTGQNTSPPTFEFQSVTPKAIYTADTSPISVTVRIRNGVGLDTNAISLVELDQAATVIANLGKLYDDGLHGDGAAEDGLFGIVVSRSWATPGQKRIAVQTTLLNSQVIWHEGPEITVLPQRPESDWSTYECVRSKAHTEFDRIRSTTNIATARVMTIAWIKQQPGVADAYSSSNEAVSIRFTSGLKTTLWLSDPESDALAPGAPISGEARPWSKLVVVPPLVTAGRVFPTSNKVIALNSLPNRFPPNGKHFTSMTQMLNGQGFSVNVVSGEDVTIDLYKTLNQYGIIYPLGHGGWTEAENGEWVLWIATGELVTEQKRKQHRAELDAGIVGEDKSDGQQVFYIPTPFYRAYYEKLSFPKSLWIFLSCSITEHPDFGNTLFPKGTAAIVGFDDHVTHVNGPPYVEQLIHHMADLQMRLGDALAAIPNKDFQWAENGQTYSPSFGAVSGSNLDLSFLNGLRNGNFESGRLDGWTISTGTGYRARANVFKVPPQYTNIAGLYALGLGPGTYPPVAGTSPPGIDEVSQLVTLSNTAVNLQFDYALSTYLPANGAFYVKLYDADSGVLLESRLINTYPGYGQQYQNFWYTGQVAYIVNIAKYRGRNIEIVFQNKQNGTSSQTVYLDNVVITES